MTIYLDNSATTFPKPDEVYEKMDYVARNYGVNAGRSSYRLAQKAEDLIEETRVLLSNLTNFKDHNRVILLPSATIAINVILNGQNWEPGDNVFYTPFEHNSVLRTLKAIEDKYHINLHEIPVSEDQCYNLEELEEKFIITKPKFVTVNHVSNVIGLVAPIKEITNLSHKYGAKILIDGAQALGAVPVDLSDINCDYYVFAGHKNLYGPFGVGGVFITSNELFPTLITGGTGSHSELLEMPEDYPTRLEAGSPNIIALAGLNAGLKWLNKQEGIFIKKQELFSKAHALLSQFDSVITHNKPKKENTFLPIISCSVKGYSPEEFAMVLDQNYDISVRAGLHCAPLAHKFLGTGSFGTIRFSFSFLNSSRDIDICYEILSSILD